MAARTSSSSSEDVLSEESDSSALNLYDSDGDNSENVQDAGPRPYQFEPRRIWRNDQRENNPEPVDSDTDRLGNRDWCECGTCQPMPTPNESVCCTEIKQVWQKVKDQPETEMKCITEHPGFQSTCLDVWVLDTAYYAYRQSTAQIIKGEMINVATLPVYSWFAGALCHLVRQTRSDTPFQLISMAPIHWLVTACNRSLFSLY